MVVDDDHHNSNNSNNNNNNKKNKQLQHGLGMTWTHIDFSHEQPAVSTHRPFKAEVPTEHFDGALLSMVLRALRPLVKNWFEPLQVKWLS